MTIKQTFIQIDLERARKIEKEREDRKERERENDLEIRKPSE